VLCPDGEETDVTLLFEDELHDQSGTWPLGYIPFGGADFGAGAGAFVDALRCPKTLLRFIAAEGADGHCEMENRSLVNRRALDWLEEQLGV
jgi:hypothetical protein